VIPIREIASALNPAPKGRRYVAILRFFCDESYDSDPKAGTGMMFHSPGEKPVYVPKTYVVGGIITNEITCDGIERRWREVNAVAGVTRYHAAAVNAREGEFENWPKEKQIEYSKSLLQILLDQEHDFHVVGMAIEASEYFRTINEFGRKKLGSPYLACFKGCISTIAQHMNLPSAGFADDDKFAIILDRNEAEEVDAVKAFYAIKDDPNCPYAHRLATCAPGSWQDFTSLQCADLIAYESFRLYHDQGIARKVRKALELMFSKNPFLGYGYDRDTLLELKAPLESAFSCVDNGFVVNFPPVTEPTDSRARS
jgi:hypothetical protein